MSDVAQRLRELLADRSIVDTVLGEHPANDPTMPPAEAFLVHGCGLLAESLALLGGGEPVVLRYEGEPLHAAIRHGAGYLDAEGEHTEAGLRARWAAIAEVAAEAIRIDPYGEEAAAWFRAADPQLDQRVERLADELVRRDGDFIAALHARA